MTAAERSARTGRADRLCADAYGAAIGGDNGVALVAVGGYGRSELAPFSDLDVVLIADDGVDITGPAQVIWYPLWDSGVSLDHSVRSLPQMLEAAASDVRVASGLIDCRHLAGDTNLTVRLRTTIRAEWRRHARARLPELRETVRARHERSGEVAHLAVPDIKEAAGGLRDATVLRALTATWLVDVPATDLERCRLQLLDVRDALHTIAGRRTDRIAPDHWAELAVALDLADEGMAQRHIRELGRRIRHLSRLAWRRADDVLHKTPKVGPRRPRLEPLSPGIAQVGGEVVLDSGARPDRDPNLLLQAAAEAATRDLTLAPPTAARLVRDGARLPKKWPAEARRQFVRLLAAGKGLLPVWETLDETGALRVILPEWERIRLLPHASTIHRFTVDRHAVETCIEASAMIRGVSRPDVLMVAALLHDIGKGGLTEHSAAGAPIARHVAQRLGFDEASVDLVELLVRHHLLLASVATTRDLDDPATIESITTRIPDRESLALLAALTEADAKATSPQAWTTWRAGLVRQLERQAAASLAGGPPRTLAMDEIGLPPVPESGAVFIVEPVDHGARVTVAAVDRVGLLGDIAAMFALRRIQIRSARAWSQDPYGVSVWEVADDGLDPGALGDQFDAIVAGRIDAAARIASRGVSETERLTAAVVVRPDASQSATVLEVRTEDRVGAVHHVCAALAGLGLSVRSAHISTLGPQAVDVFYVQEVAAGALSDERSAAAAHAVRDRLTVRTGPAPRA